MRHTPSLAKSLYPCGGIPPRSTHTLPTYRFNQFTNTRWHSDATSHRFCGFSTVEQITFWSRFTFIHTKNGRKKRKKKTCWQSLATTNIQYFDGFSCGNDVFRQRKIILANEFPTRSHTAIEASIHTHTGNEKWYVSSGMLLFRVNDLNINFYHKYISMRALIAQRALCVLIAVCNVHM